MAIYGTSHHYMVRAFLLGFCWPYAVLLPQRVVTCFFSGRSVVLCYGIVVVCRRMMII